VYNKHQIPSTCVRPAGRGFAQAGQIPNKSNEPNSKFQTPSPFPSPPRGEGWGEGRSLEIDTWGLFGACDLEFGI